MNSQHSPFEPQSTQAEHLYDDGGDGHAWQRWYDPTVGRWISEDPSGLGPDANASRYARNDPTNLTDPTGLAAYPFNDPKWFALPQDTMMTETVGPTEFGGSGMFSVQLFASSTLKDEVEATIRYQPGANAPDSSTFKFVQVLRGMYRSPATNLMAPMSPTMVKQYQGMEAAAQVMVSDRTSSSYGWGVDREWSAGVRGATIFFNDKAVAFESSATGQPVFPQNGRTGPDGKVTQNGVMMNPVSIIGDGPHAIDYIVGVYSQCAAGDGWMGFFRYGAGDDNRLFNTRYAYVGTQLDTAPQEFTDALKVFLNRYPDKTIKLP